MKMPNRDLLVLMKDECLDEDAIQHELDQLNQLLISFDTMDNICPAHEIIDVNRYRIIDKPQQVAKIIEQEEMKPFIFISNRN
jgi:hypothetical protein